ncbi:MAG: hypothetical protein AAGU32_07455 [Bacillota bacterium]
MNWKTDWGSGDDYAANASADVDRLLSNYDTLKHVLNDKLGFDVSFTLPGTNGRLTLPFADFLNAIETALTRLHVLSVSGWDEKEVTWMPAESGPTYRDVNRWEHNGELLEDTTDRMTHTINLGLALGTAHIGLYGGIA